MSPGSTASYPSPDECVNKCLSHAAQPVSNELLTNETSLNRTRLIKTVKTNSYLKVILSFLSSRIGFPSSPNPFRIFCPPSSGKVPATSSSNPISPASTTCKAAIEVKSFVCDASKKTASSLIAEVPELVPTAWV